MLKTLALICVFSVLSGCDFQEQDTVGLELESTATADNLATCISQDFESAFPQFFPIRGNGIQRSFETYNGISVAVEDGGEVRTVTVSSPVTLTSKQMSYLRQCIEMGEAS